jgi:hypothetical protein
MRNPFALLPLLCLVAGCSHADNSAKAPTTRAAVGSRVTWRGVAENHKVGAFLLGPGIYVDVPGTHWPSEVVGKTVEVQGTIVERHDLPVFIADPNEPPIAGIPAPPGTDLHEASKRFILEQVTWKAVGDGG